MKDRPLLLLSMWCLGFCAAWADSLPPAAAPGAPQYYIDVEFNKYERGSGKDGSYPWTDAVAYCQKAGARLPDKEELRRVYDAECAGGARTDTCRRWYWSSSEDGAHMAFGMRFYDRDMHSGSKYSTATGMLCLRGWGEASAYCRSKGMRLPTVKELRRVYAKECRKGARSGYCGFWYWSSEESGPKEALGFSFETGTFRRSPKTGGTSALVCVPRQEKAAGQ